MPYFQAIPDLITRIDALPMDRCIVALAGPPGAGKSTLAGQLCAALNTRRPERAAVLPMDGYHLDNSLLGARGLLPRKGAPETFDVQGFAHMLRRLRDNAEEEILVPVFDRTIEIARAGARAIPRSVPIIIAEGNYLLLDRQPWQDLRPLFDLTIRIEADLAALNTRLVSRWRDLGLEDDEIQRKVEENDLPNARLVLSESAEADITLTT